MPDAAHFRREIRAVDSTISPVCPPMPMSTPRLVPHGIKLNPSPSAPPPIDSYAPFRPKPASPEQPIAAGRPIRGRLRRLELLVVAAMLSFGYFAWRTRGQQQLFQESVAIQGQQVTKLAAAISRQDEMVGQVSQSFKEATKALASQIGGVSSQLQARQGQLETIQSRLRHVEVTMRKSSQRVQSFQPQVTQPQAANPIASASLLRAASPQNPHVHSIDTSIPMPPGALAHQNSQHEIDYWMVSRMFPSGERLIKVRPFGTNSIGVKVHSMDDGMDYILTPQGAWAAALDQQ
jgi:hypothetical protein